MWLGTIALAAAVIFFFAFNWDELGRFAKFGLVEAAILAGLLACWRVDLDGTPGKAVLILLSLLTGALLALSGQVYQTGADTFELFAWWAVLILPWVLVSRFSPLWLVWLGLLNLAAFFYFQIAWDFEAMFWALFGLNTLALVLWEAAHRAGLPWLGTAGRRGWWRSPAGSGRPPWSPGRSSMSGGSERPARPGRFGLSCLAGGALLAGIGTSGPICSCWPAACSA